MRLCSNIHPLPSRLRHAYWPVIATGALGATIFAEFAIPDPAYAWLGSAMLVTGFCAALGVAINGRAAGLLIDDRNRISLSRLQACAWSVLVLSALLTALMFRVLAGAPDPIAVDIPGDLLVAMGISGGSLAMSPAVLRLKAAQSPPAGMAAQTAAKLGDPADEAPCQGLLYVRGGASGARWLDLFRGEEVCNAAAPDLSKVQQFLMTVVVLGAYAAALWRMFAGAAVNGAAGLAALPDFSPNLVWLMGLSHAGYLAYKAAPHGPATPAEAPAVG